VQLGGSVIPTDVGMMQIFAAGRHLQQWDAPPIYYAELAETCIPWLKSEDSE